MDAIKVGIRVRPLLKREIERGSQWIAKSNSIAQKGYTSSPYYFDHVFNMDSTTIDIFNALAEPIVLSVMEGFNGTIFAYGQTSSGKTHTMMGGKYDSGIIPLTIARIFEYMAEYPDHEFLISASFLEIHNEKLTDLLNPENKGLKIREDCERNVKLVGITEKSCLTFDEIADLLRFGQSYRSTGETLLNDESSRSHSIFTLTIESKLKEGIESESDGVVKVAALNLVDLAGSERTSAAGTEGVRFKEGTYINLSLLVLGKVISQLASGSSHIPFRDSKLTRILQSSLGGNAKTCIICAMTPAEVAESHSTLKFASRAMTIKNRPKVNEVLVSEDSLLKRVKLMEAENMRLRERLEEGLSVDERHQLIVQLASSESEKNQLEERLKAALETLKLQSEPKNINKRKTFCLLSSASINDSPFVSKFNQKTFDTHLEEVQVATRSRRVSFIPESVQLPQNFYEDSLDSQDSTRHMVDVEVQTDVMNSSWLNDRNFFVLLEDDVSTKASQSAISVKKRNSTQAITPVPTEVHTSLNSTAILPQPVSVLVQTNDVLTMPSTTQTSPTSHPCLVAPEATATTVPLSPAAAARASSSACSNNVARTSCVAHNNVTIAASLGRRLAAEKLSVIQFENEELKMVVDDLQKQLQLSEKSTQEKNDELKHSEAKVKSFQKEITELELSSLAQEELLLQLQSRLKEANSRLNESMELNQTLQQIKDSSMAKIARKEQENQDLSEELAREKRAIKVASPMADSLTESDRTIKDAVAATTTAAAAAAELEQANKMIENLMLERDKLRREMENSSLDLKDSSSLLKELDEIKTQLEKASLFEEKMNRATDIIDEQTAELAALKLKLTDCMEEVHPMSAAGVDVQGHPCLSLDEELAQAMGAGSPQTGLAEPVKGEDETVARELREKLQKVTSKLLDTKSESNRIYDEWKNAQEKCEIACVEVAGLKKELLVLHNKLQVSCQTKFNCQASALKFCKNEEVEAKNDDTKRVEVLDDFVARLRSAQQDQEELKHEVENKKVELKRLQQTIEKLQTQNSCLDDVALQLRERTVEMEKEIDSLKEENRMSELQLQEVQDSLDKVKISDEDNKARATEAEQEFMFLKESLDEAKTRHEQLSASRERALCMLREQVIGLEQEMVLLRSDNQDMVETNANLLKEFNVLADENYNLQDSLGKAEDYENKYSSMQEKLEKEVQVLQGSQLAQQSSNEEVLCSLRDQLAGLEQEVKLLKIEKQDLVTKLQIALNNQQKSSSDHEATLHVKEELAQVQEELRQRSDENLQLQDRLGALQAAQTQKKIQLAQQVSSNSEAALCMKEELTKLQEEIKLMEDENYELHDHLGKAEFYENKHFDEARNLEKEVQALQESLTHKETQLAQQGETEDTLMEHLAELEQEVELLKTENQALHTKVASDGEVVLPMKELSRLQEKLELMEELNYKFQDDLGKAEFYENKNATEAARLENELKILQVVHQKAVTQLSKQLEVLQEEKEAQRVQQVSSSDSAAMLSMKKELFKLHEKIKLLEDENDKLHHSLGLKVLQEVPQKTLARLSKENSRNDGEDFIQVLGTNKVKDTLQKENQELHSTEIRKLEKKVQEIQEMHKETVYRLSEVSTYDAAHAYRLKEEIEAVRRDNTLLKQKIQDMAAVPKMSGSSVVDGSGAVTGVAFHQLQRELTVMEAEKDEQWHRAMTALNKLDNERQDFTKIKRERDVFRSKYTRMKETCTCDAAQRVKIATVQLQQQQKRPSFPVTTTRNTKSQVAKSSHTRFSPYPVKPLWLNEAAVTDAMKSVPSNEVPSESSSSGDCDKPGSTSKHVWDQTFCTKRFVWDQTFRS